jgi:C4-type Zn-finger protein
MSDTEEQAGSIPCPECNADADYSAAADTETGEILKFFWIVCDECGWDQYS